MACNCLQLIEYEKLIEYLIVISSVQFSSEQGCGVGVGAGVGVGRSRLFFPESESESESTKFTDSDRLRASSYS